MKVLGIYGSPRRNGNSSILLDEALKGAGEMGAKVSTIRVIDLDITGCRECGGCDRTGKCVVVDEMQKIYPLLDYANTIIVASPIFFYGFPAQLKALVDRCQAEWNRRRLVKGDEERKRYDSGRGYLLAVGAPGVRISSRESNSLLATTSMQWT